MGIHPAALHNGIAATDIHHAIEYAVTTIATGNHPTRILVLGPDSRGNLLEVSGVIRSEDLLIVHADAARPEYRALQEGQSRYGYSVDGLELTDALILELFRAAERGYEMDKLRQRVRPGRVAPLSVGETVRVPLDADLRDRISIRADKDGISMHECIRRALRQLLSNTDPQDSWNFTP